MPPFSDSDVCMRSIQALSLTCMAPQTWLSFLACNERRATSALNWQRINGTLRNTKQEKWTQIPESSAYLNDLQCRHCINQIKELERERFRSKQSRHTKPPLVKSCTFHTQSPGSTRHITQLGLASSRTVSPHQSTTRPAASLCLGPECCTTASSIRLSPVGF